MKHVSDKEESLEQFIKGTLWQGSIILILIFLIFFIIRISCMHTGV